MQRVKRWSVRVEQSWGVSSTDEGRRVIQLKLLDEKDLHKEQLARGFSRKWDNWPKGVECDKNLGILLHGLQR